MYMQTRVFGNEMQIHTENKFIQCHVFFSRNVEVGQRKAVYRKVKCIFQVYITTTMKSFPVFNILSRVGVQYGFPTLNL